MRKILLMLVSACFLSTGMFAAALAGEGVFHTKAGEVDFYVLQDKDGEMDNATFGNDAALATLVPSGKSPSSFNVFVVKKGQTTVLIDAGVGDRMLDRLATIGIQPEAVTAVFLTHTHGDHVGGLLGKEDAAVFPNASLWLSGKELKFWDESNKTLADQCRKAYGELKTIVADEKTPLLMPELTAFDIAGHTPGHTGFLIASGDTKIAVVGDLLHSAAIQFARPDINARFDRDAEAASKMRRHWMQRATEGKLVFTASHLPFPGIGLVETDGDAFRFVTYAEMEQSDERKIQKIPASVEEAATVEEVQAYVEYFFSESRKNMKTEEDEQRFLTTYSPVGIEGGRKIIALSTDDESLENGYGILLAALNWSIKEHPENEKEYIAVVEELKKLDKFPGLIASSRFVLFYRELRRFDPATGTLENFNKLKEEAKQLLLDKDSNYSATGPTELILEVAYKMGLAKNNPAFLDTVRDEIVRFAEEQRGVAQEELDLALRGYCRRLDGMPFELWGKTVDGKDFSWDDYKGKVVLIDFTASWCGPCRAEMPNLVEMYQTYHDQGLEVISVGYADTTENLKKMMEEDGIKFPVISEELSQEDERGIPSTHFGIHGIPEIFLVGKDGKIAATSLRGGRLRTEVAKQFETKDAMKTFHDFTVKDISGNDFPLSQLKGKKVLVVNVASKCGLTPQYEELQELYTKYGKGNFTIIAFPANNFGQQEPGTNFEIREFCTKNYGVTFPVMAKISVTGDDMHPLYHWLTKKSLNGKQDVQMEWNFQKFLVDENGNWVDFVPPREKPNCEKIIQWID